MVGSLIAAYMSTISSHLNWGSSYIAHDFYRRFVRPEADEKEIVRVGRLATVVLMALAAFFALQLENALQGFQILLQIGAGTGLLFLLRWFWWRINAWSEITAMVVSFGVALYFQMIAAERPEAWQELLIGVAITTAAWVGVTLLTPASDDQTLRAFCRRIRPGGPGWRPVYERARQSGDALPSGDAGLATGFLSMALGCLAVYGALFSVGQALFGNLGPALGLAVAAAAASFGLMRLWSGSETS